MVIRGRTRGNGRQLAHYLLFKGENEDIQILDVGGRRNPKDKHLHDAMLSMSYTSELTKSDKGLYHAQINPAYGEDRRMTSESWLLAADMLGQELGLADQRRAVVLHTKKGRTHAHVVWERYNLEKGIMVSDSFSRLAQDRARKEMERVFEQAPTPHRNVKRPEMKTFLSGLWQKTKSGATFVQEAVKSGYIIAKGVQRRPFMVVDENGRSFDLVRQLDGIKTKDVREKLKGEKLQPEKEAITAAKAIKNEKDFAAAQERALDRIDEAKENIKIKKELNLSDLVKDFAASNQEVTQESKQSQDKKRHQEKAAMFTESIQKVSEPVIPPNSPAITKDRKQIVADAFADNHPDVMQSEKERKRQEMLAQLKKQNNTKMKDQERGYDTS